MPFNYKLSKKRSVAIKTILAKKTRLVKYLESKIRQEKGKYGQ